MFDLSMIFILVRTLVYGLVIGCLNDTVYFLETDSVLLSGKMQFGSKYFSKLKYSVGRCVLS